jgi:aminoglycoside phosphotransferase (APT) family kinase protein
MDSALARRIGRSVGAILAEQHTSFREVDAVGWLPGRPSWPETGDWIRARLSDVADDGALVRRMSLAVERYEAMAVEPHDRVLVHGDVGLHNLALDPDTDAVNGIFDYGGAAWADRHHDFRYLIFDVGSHDMLDAALEVYEPPTGTVIDRARVKLCNLACAISYLAYRQGTPADETSCGRTLDENLRWVRSALEVVGM